MNLHVSATLSFGCLVTFCLATAAAVADDSTNEKEGVASGVVAGEGQAGRRSGNGEVTADSVGGRWKKAAGGLQTKSNGAPPAANPLSARRRI